MTDKDNSQTGEYSYTYSYSYSKVGGEKNVEVHTGGSSAATAGEAAVDSTGKTTAGESSSGKSATGKTTTVKSTTGKTTTRSRSTTTSSRSSTSSRSKNDNSGIDLGFWIMTGIFFATGLWPVGLIMLISKLSDSKRRKSGSATAKQAATKAGSAIQKVTQTPQYSAKSAKRMKIAGILLTIVGAVAFFNGVADNLFWLEDGFQLHYVKYFLEGLFYPTGLLAGGIGLLIGSGSMPRRHRRYASYLRIAGKRSSISVASLARAAEVSERRAERDLQAMLDASPLTNKGTNIVRLTSFGDSSINILVSAYLLTNAYAEFLQMQNDLNLNIMDIMQADGVDFAFPSTSVYIEKN